LPRAGVAFVFALLCTVPLASAHTTSGITPGSIAGIKLGMSRVQARAILAKPVRLDRLEAGYDRLVSTRQKVEVYFLAGVRGVVEVTTWNRTLKTAKLIGPCSTVVALKAAYGAGLKPFRQASKTIAYRLGNLVFTTEGGRRVGVVALGRGTPSTYVALNTPECR
jgi:hypothetical protein